jgi:hypothetical protein
MANPKNNSEVKLLRVLSLRDLVIYGIILIQSVAALPLFGHVNNVSKGHTVTTILITMAAMILTAICYERMTNRYPEAVYPISLLDIFHCFWIYYVKPQRYQDGI